jgi:hypothetical protein
VVALLSLRRHRPLMLPPVLTGAVVVAGSVLSAAAALDVARVLTVVLGLAAWASSVLPAWAVSSVVAPRVDAVPADTLALAGDVRLVHQLVLGLSATTSLLVVALAPVAVALDVGGVAAASLSAVVVILGSRHHRSSGQALVGVIGGAGAVVSTCVAVACWQPTLREGLTVVMVAVGALLLAIGRRGGSSLRLTRCCDLVETAALISLAPAVALAVAPGSWVGG